MKLHHLDDNGKYSFTKKFCLASYIDTAEYLPLDTTHHIKNLADSFDVINGSSGDYKDNQSTKLNSFEDKLVQLYDRLGRSCLYDFTSGNICIIGDDKEAIESFSTQLLLRLDDTCSLSGGASSSNISLKLLKNVDTRLLIEVSGLIPQRLMNSIIKASSTICVLPLTSARTKCPLAGLASTSPFTKRIIESLGANYELRELLIASLLKEEFLLIENSPFDWMTRNKESVRCFQTIVKQHAESINQIGRKYNVTK